MISDKLNTAVYGAKRSAIREFSRLARETPGCLALTLGEPDFDTPEPVRATRWTRARRTILKITA